MQCFANMDKATTLFLSISGEVKIFCNQFVAQARTIMIVLDSFVKGSFKLQSLRFTR
jgi:hypothetical protein